MASLLDSLQAPRNSSAEYAGKEAEVQTEGKYPQELPLLGVASNHSFKGDPSFQENIKNPKETGKPPVFEKNDG